MNADPGVSAQQGQLATVLRDLAWTIQRLVPEAAGIKPLPASEIAVLKQILRSPGITVTELARLLGMQQSNVSAAVRVLVERGLVERERDPEDRRVTKPATTEKLLGEKEAIDSAWSGTIRTALAQLSEEQLTAIENASGALRELDEILQAERRAAQAPQ